MAGVGGGQHLGGDLVQVKDFSMLDALELARQEARAEAEREAGDDRLAATGTGDFRAVAPAVQSFASGRRR
jgi:error-prone DNA polymerase